MAEVHGSSDPAFDSVRDILQQRIADGREIGAAICVNIDGENVLDIWGGYADPAKTKPWEENTITCVWSCTKVVTALAAVILLDRGLLDVNAPVAKYWPEFGANGKENIKVWHVLSHSSGIPSWEPPIDQETAIDTKKSTELLAQAGPPWWTPGEQPGYHLLNQGHMVGELVRRISGKSLTQFIADEIATPLGADFRLGVDEQDWPRTAEMLPPPPLQLQGLDPKGIIARAFFGFRAPADITNTPGWRGSEFGAANGYSNARALARIGSIVARGGVVDGKRYLSPEAIDQMIQERVSGPDLVLGHQIRFGLGVGRPVLETLPYIPEGQICYWSGWGGSMFIMDLSRKMTIGYVMNKMGQGTVGNENSGAYVEEIFKIADSLRQSTSSL